jgi:hypothetical protein
LKFGDVNAVDVVIVNATTITCKSPAHLAGPVSIVLITTGGSASAAYTYVNPPAKPHFNMPMLGM